MKKKSIYQNFSFTLNAQEWKVIFHDCPMLSVDGNPAEGYCEYKKREIHVAIEDQSKYDVKATLGHELGHAITGLLEYASSKKYDPEIVAELIGQGLAQIAWQLPKWFYTL